MIIVLLVIVYTVWNGFVLIQRICLCINYHLVCTIQLFKLFKVILTKKILDHIIHNNFFIMFLIKMDKQ